MMVIWCGVSIHFRLAIHYVDGAVTVCYMSPPSHLTLITSIRFQNDFGTCIPLYGTTISDSGFDGDNIFSIYFCAFPSHRIRSLFSVTFTLVWLVGVSVCEGMCVWVHIYNVSSVVHTQPTFRYVCTDESNRKFIPSRKSTGLYYYMCLRP